MHARDVAERLLELADLVEIVEEGEAARRAAAYRRAAQALERHGGDLAALRAQGRLTELPGVGPAIAAKIGEILDTGSCRLLDELRARVPAGVLALLQIPGVGPRTAGLIYRRLGVAGTEELEEAARSGRLRALPGFGERRERALLEALERARRLAARLPLYVALPRARALADDLAAAAGARVEVAGSLRRGRDAVGDVDLVAAAPDPDAVRAALLGHPQAAGLLEEAPGRLAVRLAWGARADLIVASPAAWPAALQQATGSTAHNRLLAERARARGFLLGPDGLRGDGAGQLLALASEEELYDRLGLAFIPPELREGAGEVEAAAAGRLPRLLEPGDIRGELHAHSDWSDGRASIEAMCAAAAGRGYAYLAITDHSPSLAVARGLTPERLLRQLEAVEAVRERFPGLTVLTGIEVDILADGRLDLPDELLARLDVVVASVHSRFQLDEEAMTRRIVAAMENPHVDIVGHPTGRVLGQRDPYLVDVERLLEAAARTRTVLELNASPDRLDLADEHLRRGKARGLRFAINCDAHAPDGFDALPYGILTARRGWLEPGDVINTLPPERLLAFLRAPKPERW